MASILKKILPAKVSIPNVDDESISNFEYSFAVEYTGPLVTSDIPQVIPVKVEEIPVASAVVAASMLNGMSLPVVQPIVKTKPSNKQPVKAQKSGFRDGISANERSPKDVDVDLGAYGLKDGSDMVCKSSLEIGSSNSLDKKNDAEYTPNSPKGLGNSGLLGSSNSLDHLHGVPENLNARSLSTCHVECIGSQAHSNYANSESTESGFCSPANSERYSCKDEDCDCDTSEHGTRGSIVTFQEPESEDDLQSRDVTDTESSMHVPPRVVNNGTKGSCYRCFKGNQLTEKEVCLVCLAKYCSKCVLRAMGSMPEGRKCITCIGYSIDESKREDLGRCSRVLKKMLTELEIKQIMKSEVSCEANQLPPQCVYVNGEHLSQEELLLLQHCPNPPKTLRPGSYWYDMVAGFWGKEGQKPCQIITPDLKVGGKIKGNASNGNTKVLINNREITKAELWMLKVAGVHCQDKPHLWLHPDGSYQDEGMNNIKGKIWEKRRTRLYCAMVNLPTPPDPVNMKEESRDVQAYIGQKTLTKLLLIGSSKSGTSAIFKQSKLLYNVPFSESERQDMKLLIQSNLYGYLGVLLEAHAHFEEESLNEDTEKQFADESYLSGQIEEKKVYSLGPRLRAFSDWFLDIIASSKLEVTSLATTREYAGQVEELWKDPAIQATYNRRNDLPRLTRAATYFMDRAIEISRLDYEPSDMDILYAEGINLSNGLSCMEFSFPMLDEQSRLDSDYKHDPSLRYQLVRLNPGSLGINSKCLEKFEDVNIVLFCVSLSEYDEFYEDINGITTNKMLASKRLFENIVTCPSFFEKHFLLILNKFDLLEEKIEHIPLTRCEWFHDFNPVKSHNPNRATGVNNIPPLAQRAFHYIASKFKKLFSSLTGDKKLYVSSATALESDSVDDALRYAREIVKWGTMQPYSVINDEISGSMEESTS